MRAKQAAARAFINLVFVAVACHGALAAEKPSKEQVQELIARSTKCISPPLGRILVYDDPAAINALDTYKAAGLIVMNRVEGSEINGTTGRKSPHGAVFAIHLDPSVKQFFDANTNCLKTGARAADFRIIKWISDSVRVQSIISKQIILAEGTYTIEGGEQWYFRYLNVYGLSSTLKKFRVLFVLDDLTSRWILKIFEIKDVTEDFKGDVQKALDGG